MTVDFEKCTGCGACVQSCPKQCISWTEGEFRFKYPQIDKDICVNCGICERVCPIDKVLQTPTTQKAYAAVHKDYQVLAKSTSGGAFTAIADAVFAQDVFERRNPASTTKVMTALIALKYGNLDDVVTVPQESVITEIGSSMAGVVPGDKLTLEQLLYGLLIPSGNDAANAIAVHMGGSIEGFVKMMNEEAVQIGATGTHFANANGLTNADHYMTAYDLYLMFHEALKYEKFRDIIGTKTYTGTYKGADGSDKTASWSVSNYYMLGKKEMPEGLSVFGGKTGTTQAAGYCLIMGERDADGKEYASVVMHADSRDALYSDMSTIIEKIDR